MQPIPTASPWPPSRVVQPWPELVLGPYSWTENMKKYEQMSSKNDNTNLLLLILETQKKTLHSNNKKFESQ